jgi:hypothetical protein
MTPIGRYFDEQMVKLAFYVPKGASREVEPLLDNSSMAVRPASLYEDGQGSTTAEHAPPRVARGSAEFKGAVVVPSAT